MPHRPEGMLRNRMRDLRAAREGMTQQDLASLAQVTRQTIIAIESGRYVPSLILAIRIARALGQTVEEVFDLAE